MLSAIREVSFVLFVRPERCEVVLNPVGLASLEWTEAHAEFLADTLDGIAVVYVGAPSSPYILQCIATRFYRAIRERFPELGIEVRAKLEDT